MIERRPISVRIDQGEKIDSFGFDLRQLYGEDELDTYFEALMKNRKNLVEYEDFALPNFEQLEAAAQRPTALGDNSKMYFGLWYYRVLMGGVHLDPGEKHGELEFWVDREAQREGCAQIAVTAMKNFFQDRKNVPLLAPTSFSNSIAQKVLGRSGFSEIYHEPKEDKIVFGLPRQIYPSIIQEGERVRTCMELVEKIDDILDGEDYKKKVLHLYSKDKIVLFIHTLCNRSVYFVKAERTLPDAPNTHSDKMIFERIEFEINFNNGNIEAFGKSLNERDVKGLVVSSSSHTMDDNVKKRTAQRRKKPKILAKQVEAIVANHGYMTRDNLTEVAQILDYAISLR